MLKWNRHFHDIHSVIKYGTMSQKIFILFIVEVCYISDLIEKLK